MFVGASSVARPGLPATRIGAPPHLLHRADGGGVVRGSRGASGCAVRPFPGLLRSRRRTPHGRYQPSARRNGGPTANPQGRAIAVTACGVCTVARSCGGNGRPRPLPAAHGGRGRQACAQPPQAPLAPGRALQPDPTSVGTPASENLPRRWSWSTPGELERPRAGPGDRKPPLTVPAWAPTPAYGAHKSTINRPDRHRLGLESDTGNKNHSRSRFRQQSPRAEPRPATRTPTTPGPPHHRPGTRPPGTAHTHQPPPASMPRREQAGPDPKGRSCPRKGP